MSNREILLEDVYNLLDKEQQKKVGDKILAKVEECMNKVDTDSIAKEFEKSIKNALCDEDFIVDNFDMDEVFEDMNKIIRQALHKYIENTEKKQNE
jgi:hypothetical protein